MLAVSQLVQEHLTQEQQAVMVAPAWKAIYHIAIPATPLSTILEAAVAAKAAQLVQPVVQAIQA